MDKDTPLQILPVANGFEVTAAQEYQPARMSSIPERSEVFVFQSFTELQKFLAEHFTHRQKEELLIDQKKL